MLRQQVAVVAVLAACLLAAPTASAVDRDTARQIYRLINQAEADVREGDRGCEFASPFDREPTTTGAAPSDALLNTLGILRRPATQEEERLATRIFSDPGPFLFGGRGFYRNHVRIAQAASGRRFVILAARDANPFRARPGRCLAKVRERFVALIADRTPRFRRAGRRLLGRTIRQEIRAGRRGPREGAFMFDYRNGGLGSGGGGASAADLQRYGGGSIRGGSKGITFSGLVPDGVATIDFVLPQGKGRRTVTVRDNVYVFRVASLEFTRIPPFPRRTIWRDADGKVIRDFDR